MHGVSKSRLPDDQKEAKRIERQKKQERFIKARDLVLKKVANCEYDDEGMKVTEAVLAANPDIYTFWNYRKRALLLLIERSAANAVGESASQAENINVMESCYRKELALTEECLRDNPKSYGAWYHRQWILEKYFRNSPRPLEILNSELRHCGEGLKYDERNFHCWDHRRFVCRLASVPEFEELNFSKEKIDENFSNYSAWHYRSSLLQRLFPATDKESILRLEERKLKEELQYAQNAFFTDPEDQSAWFYHCWLFRPMEERIGEKLHLLQYFCLIPQQPAAIVLAFSAPVKVSGNPSNLRISVDDAVVVTAGWTTPDGSRSCYIWTNYTITDEAKAMLSQQGAMITVHLGDAVISNFEITVENRPEWPRPDNCNNLIAMTTSLQPKLSLAFQETLETSLNACQELRTLVEPSSNKWPLLTEILSMRSLDLLRFQWKISSSLDLLIQADSRKRNYYEDLKSKFAVEVQLLKSCEYVGANWNIKLNDLGLTTIPSLRTTVSMIGVRELSLCGNRLTSVVPLRYLVTLVRLSLARNCLTNIEGLDGLRHLETLSLGFNKLGPTYDKALVPLKKCASLNELIIVGNLFDESENDDSLLAFLGRSKDTITIRW